MVFFVPFHTSGRHAFRLASASGLGYPSRMLNFLTANYTWILVLILLLNMSQRKIAHSNRKRVALIWIAAITLAYYMIVVVTDMLGGVWAPVGVWGGLALCLAVIIIFHRRVWPFTFRCKDCRKRLKWEYIIGHDDCLCQDCYDKKHPEEAEARRERERQKAEAARPREEVLNEGYADAKDVSEIDWDIWEPNHRCVITYVEDGDRILFIEKKRGLGEGYFNAPGGHIEEAETAMEAAVRETKEETGVDITDLEYRGTLRFQFSDGIRELGYVYFAKYAGGELVECDEARPFWIQRDAIPYENMWADDRLWLPHALAGEKFEAEFIFHDREMVSSRLRLAEEDGDETTE